MLWLAEQGFRVIGVELSAVACNDFFAEAKLTPNIGQTKKFSKYQAENIEIFCGDLYELSMADLPPIHAVYDCKAIIALPSGVRKKYIDQIISCTGSKIKILLFTRESHSKVTPPPFPINKEEIDLLFKPDFNVRQLKCVSISNIPGRLVKKGYRDIKEGVYLISSKE